MDETMLKLRIWARAEVTLAKIHANRTGRRLTLTATAIGLALLTVGLMNVGAYDVLAEAHGDAKGAFLLAGANGLLAILVLLASQRAKPGPEEDMVQEIRHMAMSELAADAEEIKQEFNRLSGHVKRIEDGLSTLASTGAGAGLSMMSSVGPVMELLVQALKTRHSAKS